MPWDMSKAPVCCEKQGSMFPLSQSKAHSHHAVSLPFSPSLTRAPLC